MDDDTIQACEDYCIRRRIAVEKRRKSSTQKIVNPTCEVKPNSLKNSDPDSPTDKKTEEKRETSDCKLWLEMTAKMIRAYEYISYPKRREALFCSKDSQIAFLNKTVFPTLLPALSRTLQLAKLSNSLQVHWRSFNGIDKIVEYIWNNNPKHPYRKKRQLFKIPFVKKYLKEHPRKPYSKSAYFSEYEAASVIQAHIKGFLVRCRPEVQEMRTFWKVYRQEKRERKMSAEKPDDASDKPEASKRKKSVTVG